MTEVSAQQFSSPEVRVVEASAGSGKTFALAKRYVQLLLNPAIAPEQNLLRQILAVSRPSRHLEEVGIEPQAAVSRPSQIKEVGILPNNVLRTLLALTFTNKAAFEMKARILDFLKKIALNALSPAEEKEILEPLNLDCETAASRAYKVMEALIHDYNFFQVQTIDSFINALLSGCAFKVGLSASFKIKTNSFDYLEYSLDALIDRAAHDKKVASVFAQFLHQYIFLENKTGWFPKKDMLSLLGALNQQGNFYGRNFTQSAGTPADLFELKAKILADMRKLKDELPEGTDGRFVKILDGFLTQYTKGFDIDRVSAFFYREELPVRKGVKVPSKLDKLWVRIRSELKDLSEGEAYSLFNPYIDVFNLAQDVFRSAAQKDDVLFLEELNKKARLLFDEGGITVEELYYRLATRFHHYLMDEFQDTSLLQWQNLHLMVEEALSTGGTLFYVGDKKQAIYGFRGGEVKLFDMIREHFKNFNVRLERLSHNYRSHENIVAFNNRVFSLSNLRRFIAAKEEYETKSKDKEDLVFGPLDYAELESVFGSSRQEAREDKPGGLVRVEQIPDGKKETRDEIIRAKLIELIKGLQGRFALSDIAILTRDNKEVEEMTGWFLEAGFFVESERTLNIQENPLIGELMAFLKFLNSPIDNTAFAGFLLGDIFSKASGIPQADLHAFVFSLRDRIKAEKDLYLYKEFRKAYPKVWDEYLDEFFRNVGLYPLYELMISILGRLRILDEFPGQQGFIMRFMELVKEREEEQSDLASFIDAFENLRSEDLYVNVSDEDAIRILTIHKSKGLEFPVVIIPFLGMETHVGSRGEMGQQSFVLDFDEERLRLLRIKKTYLGFSPELKEIYRRQYVKAFLQELNNIYVALTRAESELYVFVPKRVGSNFNFVQFLIPEDIYALGAPDGVSAKGEKKKAAGVWRLPKPNYCDWIGLLKDEFASLDEVVHREVILRGEILHFLLSRIGNLKVMHWREWMEEAMTQVMSQFPQVKKWEEFAGTVAQVIQAPKLQPFFHVEDGEISNEVEIVNRLGQTKRIDRLIVKKAEVWIVDYKSQKWGQTPLGSTPLGSAPIFDIPPKAGIPAEADSQSQQVREYITIVKDIYPLKRVRGFLVYLDGKEAEEIS